MVQSVGAQMGWGGAVAWRRGFLRVWIVASILWVTLISLAVYPQVDFRLRGAWRSDPLIVQLKDGQKIEFPAGMTWQEIDNGIARSGLPERANKAQAGFEKEPVKPNATTPEIIDALFLPILGAFLPPPLIWLTGWVFVWIWRGFRPPVS